MSPALPALILVAFLWLWLSVMLATWMLDDPRGTLPLLVVYVLASWLIVAEVTS